MEKQIIKNIKSEINKLKKQIIENINDNDEKPQDIDNYITIKLLTRGTEGNIYEIENTDTEVSYIAKTPQNAQNECDENFKKEYNIMKYLSNKYVNELHIPTVYDFYEKDNKCIIFMKKANGNLAEYLDNLNVSLFKKLLSDKESGLTEECFTSLFIQTLIGIYRINAANYVHCSIDFFNILYYKTEEEEYKYDFELSIMRGKTKQSLTYNVEINNCGVQLVPYDLGSSTKIGELFNGCQYSVQDYNQLINIFRQIKKEFKLKIDWWGGMDKIELLMDKNIDMKNDQIFYHFLKNLTITGMVKLDDTSKRIGFRGG